MKTRCQKNLGILLFLVAGAQVCAQGVTDMGEKPVRLVVGSAAGGGLDVVARILAAAAARSAAPALVVDNRPGASGTLALDLVAKAAASSPMLAMSLGSSVSIVPHTFKQLPYSTQSDLLPLMQVCTTPLVLLVKSDHPAGNFKEFVAWTKSLPENGSASFGSFGKGTSSHIVGEAINKSAGTRMTHVPYKGAAPAMTDLIGGQLSAVVSDFGSARPYLQSGGRLRALAVTGRHRNPAFPNVPTFMEEGHADLTELVSWFGVLAGKNMPQAWAGALSARLQQAMGRDEVRRKIADQGCEPTGMPAAEFSKFIQEDSSRWKHIIESVGGIEE